MVMATGGVAVGAPVGTVIRARSPGRPCPRRTTTPRPRTAGGSARPAGRPARPPPRRAWRAAIRAGSSARVMAEATRTASQPSSMARQASEAVPMPASRMTGTPACSTMSSMLWGLRMPSPLPIGAPERHDRRAARPARAGGPAPGRRRCRGGRRTRRRRAARPASSSSTASGSRVRSSPMTSSLTQSVAKASRASLAVRTASAAVKQPAVLGRIRIPSPSRRSTSECRVAGSTRRTATVASDGARGHAGRRPATRGWSCPPVPSISRDPSVGAGDREGIGGSTSAIDRHGTPATGAGSTAGGQPPAAAVTISTTSPGATGGALPGAPRHHLAVAGHGHPAGRRAPRRPPGRPPWRPGPGRVGSPLTVMATALARAGSRASANRAGRKASKRTGPEPATVRPVGPPAESPAVADHLVGGDRGQQDAVAVVAGGHHQAGDRRGARRSGRCRGSRAAGPGPASTTTYSSRAGTTRRASSTQVGQPAQRHVEVEAPLLDGGADHQAAVVAGHEVAGAPVDQAPHGPPQAGDPVGRPEPDGDAPDRPHRGPPRRRAPRRARPTGCRRPAPPAGAGPAPPSARATPRTRPSADLDPGRPGRPRMVTPAARQAAEQRRRRRPGCRPGGRRAGRRPPLMPGGQQRLGLPAGPGAEPARPAARGPGGRRGPGRWRPGRTGRRPPAGCRRPGSRRPGPTAASRSAAKPGQAAAGGQVEGGQGLLAEVDLGHRGQHAGRRPRGAPAGVGVDHGDAAGRPPAARQATARPMMPPPTTTTSWRSRHSDGAVLAMGPCYGGPAGGPRPGRPGVPVGGRP